jgi:hypothetical protein
MIGMAGRGNKATTPEKIQKGGRRINKRGIDYSAGAASAGAASAGAAGAAGAASVAAGAGAGAVLPPQPTVTKPRAKTIMQRAVNFFIVFK